ncbi:hypothetical protein V8E52_011311, partial [Russula decolorans]
PDSIYTTPFKMHSPSQQQSVRVKPSDPSKASQEVTVLVDSEALPPVLIESSSTSSTSFMTQ